MKLIPLTMGKFTMVDDEDYESLSKFKWYAKKCRNTFYAQTNFVKEGRRTTLRMHRLILNLEGPIIADHKDRNGLNNQRSNLRLCDSCLNMVNRIFKNSTGFRGVFKIKKTGRFTGAIQINKKRITIGCFKTPEEAALAYDIKAKELHGEFAILNEKVVEGAQV